MSRLARQSQGDDGFTLVELLIAIVLTGVVGAVMLTGVVRSLDVTAEATTRVDALAAMQRVMERMSRNIRAADPVQAATATTLSLEVYDDVTRRQITYTHSGATITQTVLTFANHITVTPSGSATTTTIDGLQQGGAAVFSYYTVNGTSWDGADVEDIARVEVHLRHAVDEGDPIQLTTSAFVRNTLG